ncbi:MFS transporter [Sphingomonas montanisoli]|uniref:MFS transporter n=1 Tax=Sphingomonas montanisoli TaxID=2606412 RepID=A0A5D9CC74_9SPHN|nr:MFS transporter [Sphingomonas montanisoli]TZG29568.1 MFS transporter [Sphingomonas montanisoli]
MAMKKIYYGWYLVAACILIYMAVIGTGSAAYGLYVKPVAAEFDLSRATMNTGMILFNVGMALTALVVGRLIDRFPLRPIMIVSGIVLGGCMALLGLSDNLMLDAFVIVLPLAAGTVGAGTLTVTVLLARWFTKQRGRVLALAAMGMSLSNLTVIPVIGHLIAQYGWRHALVLSGIGIAVVVCALAMIVRDRPNPDEVEPGKPSVAVAGAPALGVRLTVRDILTNPHFWLIGIGAGIGLAIMQTLGVSLVPLATDGGLTIVQATSLLSVMGITAVASKLTLAVVADYFDRSTLLASCFTLLAIANATLLIDHSYGVLLAICVLIGMASGTGAPLYYALVADRFGTISLGTVRGLMTPLTAALAAVFLRFGGEVFDRTGSYRVMFVSFAAAAVIAALLLLAPRIFPTKPELALTPAT